HDSRRWFGSALQAGRAGAAQLDNRLLGLEAVVARPGAKAVLDDIVRELVNLAAFAADREGDHALLVAVGVGAGNERIERFEPVDEAGSEQLFERAVDL